MTAKERRECQDAATARRLYMQLRGFGWRLTKQQYMTCKGWIGAGRFEQAERFMEKHGPQKEAGA